MDAGTGLRRLLDDAHAALAAGDASDAERRAKAASALLRAERDLAEYVAAQAASRRTRRNHPRRDQKPHRSFR